MFRDLKFRWKCLKASYGHWSWRRFEMAEAFAMNAALNDAEALFFQDQVAVAKQSFFVCLKEIVVEVLVLGIRITFNAFILILVFVTLLFGLVYFSHA